MIICCNTCSNKDRLSNAKAANDFEARKKWIEFCHVCLRPSPNTVYPYKKRYSEYGYGSWTPNTIEILEKELFEI